MVGGHHPLKSRRVVLTGASRGLGRALALAFSEAGADLLLVARPSAEFDGLAADLSAERLPFQSVETIATDLARPSAAAQVVRRYRPHVLINNAAEQGPIGPLWTIGADAWQRTLTVDLTAPAMLMAAVIPAMIEIGEGCIVNIAGGGAAGSRPRFTAYAAAKAGLVRLTECVADEVREYGIAVTAVAPGVLPTSMTEEIVEAGPHAAGTAEVERCRAAWRASGAEQAASFRAVTDFCVHLAEAPRMALSGRLIGPRWDAWRDADHLPPNTFTLRRVEPIRA